MGKYDSYDYKKGEWSEPSTCKVTTQAAKAGERGALECAASKDGEDQETADDHGEDPVPLFHHSGTSPHFVDPAS